MRRRRLTAATAATLAAALAWWPAAPALAAPPAKPNYERAQSWVGLPKTPPSAPAKKVDVFWVYPTVYNGKPTIAAVDDPQMRRGAEHSLLTQASVFADSANIFAPLYRQANISALSMPAAEQQRTLGIGLADVEAAFAYYMKHWNHGRPFILAGHSQGANLLADLVRQKLGDPVLRKQMIAAYLIGWSVTDQDLKQYTFMKMCRAADETHCLISYNSVAAGSQAKAPTILPGAISVNPLSWRTDDKLAPASQNLGAVFFDDEGRPHTIAHFTSARNAGGGLVVEPKDPARLTHLPFGPGVYHAYDYELFYKNLKANAAKRIAAFEASGARGH